MTHDGYDHLRESADDDGRSAYVALADELTPAELEARWGPVPGLDEFDADVVESARAYAAGLGLAFPPSSGLDLALAHIAAAERAARVIPIWTGSLD